MKIQITDDYVMTSDTYNFILNRKVTVQKGKHAGEEALDPIGFYSRVEDLLVSLIDKKMARSTKRTLKGFLQEHRDFCAEIRSLFDKGIIQQGKKT